MSLALDLLVNATTISATADLIKYLSQHLRSEDLKKLADSVPLQRDVSRMRQEQEIAECYRAGTLVLVLGAGVSREHGLPDWNTLLQKLLLSTLDKDSDEAKARSSVLARTFTLIFSPDPLIAARYLYNYYRLNYPDDNLAFDKAVREAIYDEIDMSNESKLFKEIRQLCIAPGKSPNLDCIITYNYDDLVETYLTNIELDVPFKSIYAPGMNPEPHELAIHHVHGYLPREGDFTEKNQVTLSEDLYHRQYSDVYGWSNLVQINRFKDRNCLFIGTSFTDPNLRRLLDIAKVQRGDAEVHHYLIKKHYDRSEIEKTLQAILDKRPELLDEKIKAGLELEETVTGLINIIQKFEEQDALSFGVDVLWVNEYNDIPDVLSRVRKHTSSS